MSYENNSVSALDYAPCRYGTSKLVFRGPKQPLDRAFCAVLGGNETYGRFVARPYPALADATCGLRVVNLGVMNASVDVYMNDTGVIDICNKARITVVQLMGAANMSNRFYAVHPRRNDRFLRASALMKALYPDVDFTEFNFTRHMLLTLQERSPQKFEAVVEELKTAWVARMQSLLGRITGKTVLVWTADHAPAAGGGLPRLDRDPILVDRDMIAEVAQHATDYLEIVSNPDDKGTTEGMVCAPFEAAAAAELPGPKVHAQVARSLGPLINRLSA